MINKELIMQDIKNVTKQDFYYCFGVNNEEDLNYIYKYNEISPNPEDYQRCVVREKCMEIYSATQRSKCIFYNSEKKLFTDCNFNQIDIKNLKIFPRVDIPHSIEIIEQINLNQGLCINSVDDIKKIIHWSNFYQTRRKLKILSMEEYLNNPEFYFNAYKSVNGKLFLKTLNKSSHTVIIDEPYDYMMEIIPLNQKIMISEYIDIQKDNYGKKEFRCYVINKDLISISRYLDYENHEIPKEIQEFALNLINEMNNDFPYSYVVDLVIYSHNGGLIVDVMEFNPIISSGRYVLNTI